MYNKKKYKEDIAIVVLIILAPFLFYTYLLFSKTKELEVLGYSVDFYEELQYDMWVLYYKVFTLFVFTAWYFTCEHWWRSLILIPILMELHKFGSVLNDHFHWYDTFRFFDTLPLTIPVLVFIVWLSKKGKSLGKQVDKEINHITLELSQFNKENYNQARLLYKELQKEKGVLDKKIYLKRLVQIRETYLRR